MVKRGYIQLPEREAEGQVAFSSSTEQDEKQSHETWNKFVEPHSWAMKWCGFALSCAKDNQAREKSTAKEYRH